MTTVEALLLLAEQTEGERDVMLKLADAYRDAGEEWAGYACEWCARRGRFPLKNVSPSRLISGSDEVWWEWRWDDKPPWSCQVPDELSFKMWEGTGHYKHSRYASLANALMDLGTGLHILSETVQLEPPGWWQVVGPAKEKA
jgi:hypothetical protein